MSSQSRHSSGAVGPQAPPRTSDHAHGRPHRDRTAAAAGAGPRARLSTWSSRSTTSSRTSSPSVRRLHALPHAHLPLRLPHHDRRQREHGHHLADRWHELAERARRTSALSVWSRRAAGGRCGRSGRLATRPSLAYMDVDLSTDLDALLPLVAPLCRATATWRSAPGWPAPRAVVRGPKRELISRALQPDPAGVLRARFSRRAVRLQGGARRRAPRACCRWSRTRAGSSTPSCWCSPSATACASTRCPSTGSTTPTAGSTRLDGPRRPAGRGAARPRPGHRPAAARRDGGRVRRGRPRGVRFAAQALRFAAVGVASTVAYLLLFVLLRVGDPRGPRQRARPAGHGPGQHRRQPPLHLRGDAAGAAPSGTTLHGLALFGVGLALTSRPLAAAAPCADPPVPWPRDRGRSSWPTLVTTALRFSPALVGLHALAPPRAACLTPPHPFPYRRDPTDALDASASHRRAPLRATSARRRAAPARPALGAPRAARACWSRPPCCTSGTWAPPAGPTPSTPPPPRPARRAGRPSSSARSTPRTPSPSTSRRRPCGSWACRCASSA